MRQALGSLRDHYCTRWLDRESNPAYWRDTVNVPYFVRELKAAERSGAWPNLMIVALPEDHTEGLKAGAFTPAAEVALNDQALGMIVDAVSHSRFWSSTAIFAIEDDAQNGPDHVDAHRTVSLVASPYARRAALDSTRYSTVSVVRTNELMLGLPPMTQFDRRATPMYGAFTTSPDFRPYTIQPPQIDLMACNPVTGDGARTSARLDLRRVDRADPEILNRILGSHRNPERRYPVRCTLPSSPFDKLRVTAPFDKLRVTTRPSTSSG